MVEEAVALEGEEQLRAKLLDGDAVHPADGGFFRALEGAEGLVVVRAAQVLGGAAHGGHVQRFVEVVEVVALEDVRLVAVPDAVGVGLAGAGEAGVEARLDLLQGDSADVGGEVAAQAVQDFLGGQLGLGAEGDDLALGVGPGIGAAGGGDLDGLVQQAGELRLQLSLDGVVGVSLLLPALPAGAVVAEGETVVGHGCSPLFCQSSCCMGGKKKFSPILLYFTGFSRT